ncbi:hypothetical protein [Pollutibacter soli]|uniref:hypothetical protein n=1 Tax=Pollutibacter soli TaxID=3034157 RepID=UPI003013FF15
MKRNIHMSLLTLLMVCILGIGNDAKSQSDFSRNQFYKAMQGKDEVAIDTQLNILKDSQMQERVAFEGALFAKKASMQKKAHDKLKLFKKGAGNLQSAIKADENNTEYRFLRLMIQEHAPKIVNYDNDLQKDSKFIRANFSSLSTELKKIIKNYSKSSTILKPEDFN